MVKNIFINGKNPIDRYSNGKKIVKTYRNGYIIWDVSENEHLKVQEDYKRQKFLESYREQSISTRVYWVHKYQGQMIETSIPLDALNSWECDTLEPYMYLNGATQYVGYYKLPAGEKFGQHNMKITFKSPETGNILSVEYPIYHLKEVSLNIGDTINWYPFRLALHLENFGYGSLVFECNDKDFNTIRDTRNVIRNLSQIKYNFLDLGTECNAMFKFGENQIINYNYISDYTHKSYNGNSIWNIRPYWHTENTNTLEFSAIDKQNIKDLRCTEFGININNEDKIYTEDVYSLTWQKHNRDISPGGEELNDITKYGEYQLSGYVSGSTWVAPTMETLYAAVSRKQISSSEYLDTCESMNLSSLTESAKFYTTMKFEVPLFWNEFHLNNEPQIQKYPEVGYVYWGDGTFDYYRPGNYRLYQDKNVISSQKFDEISYQNGRKLNGNNFEPDYYHPFIKLHQDHAYEKNGLYNVIITAPYQAQSVYHEYSSTKYVTQGTLKYLYPYVDTEENISTRDWNYGSSVKLITNVSNVSGTTYNNIRLRAMIIGQANGEETGYKAHVIPFIPLCNQVKSLYIGKGSMMGMHNYYVNNNSSIYSKNSYYGDDGVVKFTHEMGLLPGVGADGSITLLPVYNINVVAPSSTGDNININDGCLVVDGTPLDYLTSLERLTIVGLSPTIRCHNKQPISTGAIGKDHLIWYAPSLNGLEYLSTVENFNWAFHTESSNKYSIGAWIDGKTLENEYKTVFYNSSYNFNLIQYVGNYSYIYTDIGHVSGYAEFENRVVIFNPDIMYEKFNVMCNNGNIEVGIADWCNEIKDTNYKLHRGYITVDGRLVGNSGSEE